MKVRFTVAGAAKYRQSQDVVMERLRARDGYALVRYSDGSEAVYEEAFLEAV